LQPAAHWRTDGFGNGFGVGFGNGFGVGRVFGNLFVHVVQLSNGGRMPLN
jgi:hypothetical protein